MAYRGTDERSATSSWGIIPPGLTQGGPACLVVRNRNRYRNRKARRSSGAQLTYRIASESVKQQCTMHHFAQEDGAHDGHERSLQDMPAVTGGGVEWDGLRSFPPGHTGVAARTDPVRTPSVGFISRQTANHSKVWAILGFGDHIVTSRKPGLLRRTFATSNCSASIARALNSR